MVRARLALTLRCIASELARPRHSVQGGLCSGRVAHPRTPHGLTATLTHSHTLWPHLRCVQVGWGMVRGDKGKQTLLTQSQRWGSRGLRLLGWRLLDRERLRAMG